MALISFLITGFVVTRLIVRAREAADSAALGSDPNASLEDGLLRPVILRFNLAAVCLFDAAKAQLQIDGHSFHHLADQTRTAISGRNSQNGESGVAVRLLRDEHKVIGAIGFDGLQDVELTAEPLAALAGLTRFATGKVQADRKPGREAYGVSYPDLMPLSRTFFDVFAIETALIVSPFNLPVTVTLSLRNDRILSGSPVTEYDQPKISKDILRSVRLYKAIRFTSPDALFRMPTVIERRPRASAG